MIDNRKIKCPFCEKENINVTYIPPMKRETRQSFGRSHTKSVLIHIKEKYTVSEDCPHCGASKQKIEKVLNTGEDYKKPSREDVIKRLKEAGLPTKI